LYVKKKSQKKQFGAFNCFLSFYFILLFKKVTQSRTKAEGMGDVRMPIKGGVEHIMRFWHQWEDIEGLWLLKCRHSMDDWHNLILFNNLVSRSSIKLLWVPNQRLFCFDENNAASCSDQRECSWSWFMANNTLTSYYIRGVARIFEEGVPNFLIWKKKSRKYNLYIKFLYFSDIKIDFTSSLQHFL